MIFFTADQHLGHRGIISMQNRPFDSIEDVRDFMTVSLNGRYFALMHYPMLSWPKKNSGSIQLHGHIHARMDYNEQNREEGILRYDVGVDANNFYPVSVKQIIDFFSAKRMLEGDFD